MAEISGHAVGDDFDIERTVTGLPAGVTLAKAWLMVKRSVDDPDASAVIPKTITTVAVDGTGQITDAGATDGTGTLLFQVRRAESSTLVAGKVYLYGIKVLLSNGLVDTLETGTLTLNAAVVQTSS